MGLLALTACNNGSDTPESAPLPPEKPAVVVALPPVHRPDAVFRASRAQRTIDEAKTAKRAAGTPASQNLQGYYQGVEDMLVARGELRHDDGTSIPVSAEKLADDFIKVALYDEYTRENDELVAKAQASHLRRWNDKVRISIGFGDSVPPATRTRDRHEVQSFAERMAEVTGHDIVATPGTGNFTVLFVSEDERQQIGSRLMQLIPGIPGKDIDSIQSLSPQIYCTVFAYSMGQSPVYTDAVAVIRSELSPRLRTSCIQEELSQGMGLANDSPDARPSIFNDDEEFALLTHHDQLLLKMLYDPRLKPGMTIDEARPIILKIAHELTQESP